MVLSGDGCLGRRWFNGAMLDADQARIDPADRGFLLGDGVFETVRAEAGVALHLDRHLARMQHGAAVLRLDIPWSPAAIAAAMAVLLQDLPDAVLRLTLSRGPAPRGLLPAAGTRASLLITAAPLPPPPTPARVIVSTRTRRNEHSPLAGIKSLNYLDSVIARQEAAEAGADDAILLNTAGHVAEASAGNLFVRLEGGWVTPPVRDGALPGIARALILEAGLATERTIEAGELGAVEAGFISSSLARRPVRLLSGRALDWENETRIPL